MVDFERYLPVRGRLDHEEELPKLVTSIAHNGRVLSLRSPQVGEPASLFVALEACVCTRPLPSLQFNVWLV